MFATQVTGCVLVRRKGRDVKSVEWAQKVLQPYRMGRASVWIWWQVRRREGVRLSGGRR